VDLDADGYPDILSGSYCSHEPPKVGLFYVLYGKPDGTFRKAEVLKGTDGKPLVIPTDGKQPDESWFEAHGTRPFAVDWDGDGHLDLIVGNNAGHFYWFKGEGKGKFRPKPEIIKCGGSPLTIEGEDIWNSDPFAIDWDGDGALDIVSGSWKGGVQWAKNHAPKGKPPEFSRFEWLIRPDHCVEVLDFPTENEIAGPSHGTRVWVGDVNGDGKLDVLVGDFFPLVYPAKGLTPEEFKKKRAAWKKVYRPAYEEFASIKDSDKSKRDRRDQLVKEIGKLYKQADEFEIEARTGFVWLYLQK
jgi:FG-GAP-like repeat